MELVFLFSLIGFVLVMQLIEKVFPNFFSCPVKKKVVTANSIFYDDAKKRSRFLMCKQDYFNSQTWKEKRHRLLTDRGFKCDLCESTGRLEVHHISGYNRIPNEFLSDLTCLCRSCHQLQHDHYGYPDTYKDYMTWSAPLIKGK
jgi:hypothetical protein